MWSGGKLPALDKAVLPGECAMGVCMCVCVCVWGGVTIHIDSILCLIISMTASCPASM